MIDFARTDSDPLGQLLERYRPYLLTVAQRKLAHALGTERDALDVVQDTCENAFRAFGVFRGSSEAQFCKWILTIHQNNIIDHIRRRTSQVRDDRRTRPFPYSFDSTTFIVEPPADQSTPSQRVIRGEQALRLAEILQSLPERQRRAVCMKHMEGLTLEEVAELLDCTTAAAAGLIKRGLAALRDVMSEDSWSYR